MRVGIGYDAHRLTTQRPLVLGGVVVPFGKGLEGFSDGDAAIHAIIDALFGAAALGDCGSHFPAGDERFANARSLTLLSQAVDILNANGYGVGNVDCTIVAEQPTLHPFIASMRLALADALRVEVHRVSMKAKRPEGLGFAGDGSGIEAHAVALVEPLR